MDSRQVIATEGPREQNVKKYDEIQGTGLPQAYSEKKNNQSYNSSSTKDVPTRPCAVIGPDLQTKLDLYVNNTVNPYYKFSSSKMGSVEHSYPPRNISPRQTFQENMPRIMLPPRMEPVRQTEQCYNSDSVEGGNYVIQRKLSLPSKNCDVPYIVNSNQSDRNIINRNDLHVSPPSWQPYPSGYYHRSGEFPNCPPPHAIRPPLNKLREDIPRDSFYRGSDIRLESYPTLKDKQPHIRYDFPYNLHSPYPSHHYPLPTQSKHISHRPYINYDLHHRYTDNRVHEMSHDYTKSAGVLSHASHQYIDPRNQIRQHGPLFSRTGYSYPIESEPRNMAHYNTSYDPKRPYLEHNRLKNSSSHLPDYPIYDSRGNSSPNNYPANSLRGPITPYQRGMENVAWKPSLEHVNNLKTLDSRSLPYNPLANIPSNFSPTIISPSDSQSSLVASTNSQEDCGYASQSSVASSKSIEYPKQSNYDLSTRTHSLSANHTKRKSSNKDNTSQTKKDVKSIDLRQFIQMWDEEFEETPRSAVNEAEVDSKPKDELVVLEMVSVPKEELSKYKHIQKVSKLPDNIKGYSNLELLNQFDMAFENTEIAQPVKPPQFIQNSKVRDNNLYKRDKTQNSNESRRSSSPLDFEAKISQSIIHKEDKGCINFEIRPCSPFCVLPQNVMLSQPKPLQGQKLQMDVKKLNTNIQPVHASLQNQIYPFPQREQHPKPTNPINYRALTSSDNTYTSSDNLKESFGTISNICLASLPRIDREFELNIPEINNEYNEMKLLSGNKIDSESDICSENISSVCVEATNLSVGVSYITEKTKAKCLLSPGLGESNQELSKLTKFRINKSVKLEELKIPGDTTVVAADTPLAETNSNLNRTDSVIIHPFEMTDKSLPSLIDTPEISLIDNIQPFKYNSTVDIICKDLDMPEQLKITDGEKSNKISINEAINLSLHSNNGECIVYDAEKCSLNHKDNNESQENVIKEDTFNESSGKYDAGNYLLSDSANLNDSTKEKGICGNKVVLEKSILLHESIFQESEEDKEVTSKECALATSIIMQETFDKGNPNVANNDLEFINNQFISRSTQNEIEPKSETQSNKSYNLIDQNIEEKIQIFEQTQENENVEPKTLNSVSHNKFENGKSDKEILMDIDTEKEKSDFNLDSIRKIENDTNNTLINICDTNNISQKVEGKENVSDTYVIPLQNEIKSDNLAEIHQSSDKKSAVCKEIDNREHNIKKSEENKEANRENALTLVTTNNSETLESSFNDIVSKSKLGSKILQREMGSVESELVQKNTKEISLLSDQCKERNSNIDDANKKHIQLREISQSSCTEENRKIERSSDTNFKIFNLPSNYKSFQSKRKLKRSISFESYMLSHESEPKTKTKKMCLDKFKNENNKKLSKLEQVLPNILDDKFTNYTSVLKLDRLLLQADGDKLEAENVLLAETTIDQNIYMEADSTQEDIDSIECIFNKSLERENELFLSKLVVEKENLLDDRSEQLMTETPEPPKDDSSNVINDSSKNKLSLILKEINGDTCFLVTEELPESIFDGEQESSSAFGSYINDDESVVDVSVSEEHVIDSDLHSSHIENDVWLDDVACVETVVSENVNEDCDDCYHDTEDDNDMALLESREAEDSIDPFNFISQKLKDLYGDSICVEDMKMSDYLYKAPNVNITNRLIVNELLESYESNFENKHSEEESDDDTIRELESGISKTFNYNLKLANDEEQESEEQEFYTTSDNTCSYLLETKDNSTSSLITKAAQKYIPPLKLKLNNLIVRLPLSSEKLNYFQELKKKKKPVDSPLPKLKVNTTSGNSDRTYCNIPKKIKPKFEDVLKNIDESMQMSLSRRKRRKSIPKMIIKKNEHGSHYSANVPNSKLQPDLTGSKWQPWVHLQKNDFIEEMVSRSKNKAIYSHERNCFVIFRKPKYKQSIINYNSMRSPLKYTIKLCRNSEKVAQISPSCKS